MGATHLKMLRVLLLLTLTEICAAENDITMSVFTVTSKSITVQWTKHSEAKFYKITATPMNSPEPASFAQYGENTVMGSINSLSPNTRYTLQVEAMNNAFNVISSADTEETTAPEVPAIEKAYSKQSDSVTVEFSEVAGATSYILRAETDSGDFFSETCVRGSPGTVVDLQPYRDYSLSVISVNATNDCSNPDNSTTPSDSFNKRRSQPSYPVPAKTVVVAPQLNTSSPSNDTIIVNWSPVEHAVLYTLSIFQQGSDSRRKLNTTDLTVTFDGLEAGMTYCFKITAWDSEGRAGDDFNICQITRPPSPDPVHVLMTQGRSTGLAVYWQRVQGADNYTASSNDSRNCTSDDTTCIISPMSCGHSSHVMVTAHNKAGPSSPSQPQKYITFPCSPKKVWIEEYEAGRCRVMWSGVKLMEHYISYVKRDDGSEKQCNTTKTTCQFDCMCGYTYLTTVFAINHAGTSPQGLVVNYTTMPCCPEEVSVQLVSTETLEIMWSPVRGVELYETKAIETKDVIHCNDTAPMCALSDLRCNTVYSVVVTPCSESRGCNRSCTSHTHETAPCSPEILNVTQTNVSTVTVLFTTPNTPNTNYTISAVGRTDRHTCHTQNGSCAFTQLPCGTSYEVTAVATTAVGRSLPSFSVPLETGPCCPSSLRVEQVTQAMTNVSWSPGLGARSYMAALTSPRGHGKCHTLDTHCLMGCITCGTNYSVTLEAISSTGHKSECSYPGFPAEACCPTGVKLYRMANNSLRVFWRSSGSPPTQSCTVDLYGTGSNHTCDAVNGSNSCDVQVICGDVYTVVVAPVGMDGSKISFCPRKMYSVPCPGSNAGLVIYRGKRSVG